MRKNIANLFSIMIALLPLSKTNQTTLKRYTPVLNTKQESSSEPP